LPGVWNKVKLSLNKKIFLATSGGLHIAQQIIDSNSEFSNFGLYSCPIWGAKYKNLQQSQIDEFDEIITVEDHLLDCGFGSWIRESITDSNSHIKIVNKALNQNVIGKVGTEEYLLRQGGFNI
jgi:transketolase